MNTQYYGINEDEADLEESILNGDSLGSLEVGARQLAKTAMQSAGYDDINQLKDAVRDGALKVSVCLRFSSVR